MSMRIGYLPNFGRGMLASYRTINSPKGNIFKLRLRIRFSKLEGLKISTLIYVWDIKLPPPLDTQGFIEIFFISILGFLLACLLLSQAKTKRPVPMTVAIAVNIIGSKRDIKKSIKTRNPNSGVFIFKH